MFKKQFSVVFFFLFLFSAVVSQATDLQSIQLYSHIENEGQILDTIECVRPSGNLPDDLRGSDFRLYAEIKWTDQSFSVYPDDLERTRNGFRLHFSSMPETWNNVAWWQVNCRDASFSFSKENLSSIHADVADAFVRHSVYDDNWRPTGDAFDYSLFSPVRQSVPVPLVLVLHGSGDFDIVHSGRQALCWAEPDFQTDHPCYVMVPYFEEATLLSNDEVLIAAKQEIQRMIRDGLVDASRVYVTGLSLGGWNAFRLLTRYSETPFFAAGILMCPWLDRSLTDEELSRAVNTPLYVLYGEGDTVVPDPGEIADRLLTLGSTLCHKKVYRTEEYAAAGIESQHAVDLLALQSDEWREWMMSHHL